MPSWVPVGGAGGCSEMNEIQPLLWVNEQGKKPLSPLKPPSLGEVQSVSCTRHIKQVRLFNKLMRKILGFKSSERVKNM